MKPYDHLVFDLDDTLLDTYGQLLPHAAKEACAKMIEAGLATDIGSCLSARDEIAQTENRRHLFESLVQRFGTRNKPIQEIAIAGFKAFYDRKISEKISLFSGAREMLDALKKSYGIHLVTAGHPATQEEKLKLLNLHGLFDSVTIVNTFNGETKSQAFTKIAKQTSAPSERHLSIGNRLDTDIAPAKALGWRTCWVKYGEYARSKPTRTNETPDFTVTETTELVSACQL